jgi:hypothetical protein
MGFWGRLKSGISGGLKGFVASGFNPVGAAAGFGVGALTGGGGDEGEGGGREERDYRRRFGGIVNDMGKRYGGREDAYLDDLEGFNPEQAFADKTRADLDAADDDFARTYADRIGESVGRGRNPAYSGFGLKDAQDTIEEGQQIRGQIRMRNSDALAGMKMQHLGQRGDYIRGGMDRYAGMVGDRLNTMEGQRLTDQASKRSMWGQMAQGAAGVAGAYFGGRGGGGGGGRLARDTW